MNWAFSIVVIWLVSPSISGQSPSTLIANGRAALSEHNITNANTNFRAAVAAEPSEETANVLYAATRLLWLANDPIGNRFLDRLGVSKTNRNIYHWNTHAPSDTNHIPFAPSNVGANEAVELFRTNLLSEIGSSIANLDKVVSPSFALNLSSNETTAGAVTLDLGDIMLLKSILHFTRYLGYTISSWNYDIQLTAIRSLVTDTNATIERFLFDYPTLGTFSTTNDLSLARTSFEQAASWYFKASDFMRARPTNVIRLFNYDWEIAEDEQKFRHTVQQLVSSLNGPVFLDVFTNIAVDVGAQFSSPQSVRDFLPEFRTNAVVAGTLPEGPLRASAPTLSKATVERALAKSGVRVISQFVIPARGPDGRFMVRLNAVDGSYFEVQVSNDLRTWATLGSTFVKDGVLPIEDADASSYRRRFYRAVDRSGALKIHGSIHEVGTDKPIQNATISLVFVGGLVGATTLSDGSGEFSTFALQTRTQGSYTVSVAVQGYPIIQLPGSYSDNRLDVPLPLYIAPSGFAPTNDDFSDRAPLSGTDLKAVGYNVGATREAGEPSLAGGFGQTLWWSWTAPKNGAIRLDSAESSSPALVEAYLGNSVSTLTRAGSTEPAGFFVEGGRTYSIQADSTVSFGGKLVLHLGFIIPEAPRIVRQPKGQSGEAGQSFQFSVTASGTGPLYYQWQKAGIDVPSATNSRLVILNATLEQSGDYSVFVRNGAGGVMSASATLNVAPNDTGAQFAPTTQAAFLQNTYTVTLSNGRNGTLTFPTANTYSFTPAGGAAETGTINNLNLQGEDWVGTIAPNGATDTVRAGELRAHFTGKNGNSFAGNITYQGANGPVTIPFVAAVNTGGTTSGTTAGGTTSGTSAGGTTAGTTAGGTPAGGTGSIVGKTLRLNYQPSGGEKFQFVNDTIASYEGGAETAVYTYNQSTGQLRIIRPGGQTYQMVIPPGTSTGAVTVVYINGGQSENDPATYTLQ